jgi:phosphoribosylanthranilate isomerase
MAVTRVKICGITNEEDALKAAYYGAWAVGFIFYKESPRYVSPSKARKIIEALPPFVTPVGVFVNQRDRAVRDICGFTRIHTVQFHGEEEPAYCKRFKEYKIIKAFRVRSRFDLGDIRKYKVDAYLFDTYKEGVPGGTGEVFDWGILKGEVVEKPFILSGGLGPENVQDALRSITPYAVDSCSGVEKFPGVKDHRRMKTFLDFV